MSAGFAYRPMGPAAVAAGRQAADWQQQRQHRLAAKAAAPPQLLQLLSATLLAAAAAAAAAGVALWHLLRRAALPRLEQQAGRATELDSLLPVSGEVSALQTGGAMDATNSGTSGSNVASLAGTGPDPSLHAWPLLAQAGTCSGTPDAAAAATATRAAAGRQHTQ